MTVALEELADAKVSLTDVVPSLTLTHKLHEVSFGSKATQQELAKRYWKLLDLSFGGSRVTDFNKAESIEAQTDATSCFYYLKAVPNTFVQNEIDEITTSLLFGLI